MMLKMHHIGIVVKNIDSYLKYTQYNKLNDPIYDPIQNSNILILQTINDEPLIELIEPLNENSYTYGYLKKYGNGMHHICYIANSIIEVNEYILKFNFKKILGPIPAIVFNNDLVIFAYSRSHGIVEFLVSKK